MQAAAMGEMMTHITLDGDSTLDQEPDVQAGRAHLEENKKRYIKIQDTHHKSWMRTNVTDTVAQHGINVTPAHARMEEDLTFAVHGLL
jgi:hypothetical protein